MCLVVTCWERADLLALVWSVLLWVCDFPIGILGQVVYFWQALHCDIAQETKSRINSYDHDDEMMKVSSFSM